jgi:hypothetical protein
MRPEFPFFLSIAFTLIGLATGFLINEYFHKDKVLSFEIELNELEKSLNLEMINARNDAKFIKRLAAEAEINRTDAQRYSLVRYYIENDHGELAIEAFFGPQAILRANALDALLDEELDRRYIVASAA